MQKFTDTCSRQGQTISPYQYVLVDYNNSNYHNQFPQGYMMDGYSPYQYAQQQYYQAYPQYLAPSEYHAGDLSELNQMKRSLGCVNLVHTNKKKDKRYK